MRGLEFSGEVPAGKVAALALEKGLMIITAGGNVLRFVPPLVIEEADIDEAVSVLDSCIAALTA